MFPSSRSRLALLLLTVLFAYNLTAVLSTAGATDASDQTDTAATEEVVTEEAPAEEAPAEEAPVVEEAAPVEEASSDESTFIEPVTERATSYAKAKSTKEVAGKFSSSGARTERATKTSAPQRITAAGDFKILVAGTNTEVKSNNPHPGICSFDLQWDNFDANTLYTWEVISKATNGVIISGDVTTDGNGFAKESNVTFTPANLAGIPLGAQGYHVNARESGGKQKTFWVDGTCGGQASDKGKIKIVKAHAGDVPAAGNFAFNFDGDVDDTLTLLNPTYASVDTGFLDFNVNDGVNDQAYTVTEVLADIPANWQLTNIVCSDQTDTSVNILTGTASIKVSKDEEVTCTFTNTYTEPFINPGTPGGTIRVDKVTDPAGSTQSFDFTLTPTAGAAIPFSLTDAATPFSSNQPVGTYSVAETVPAGWDLTSATCSDGSPASAIALGSAETVTCTFTNTLQRGSITVVKDAIPLTTSSQTFGFTGDLIGDLGDGASVSADVLPGTYTVTEATVEDWELTDISCTDPTSDSSGDVGSATATFIVDAGEDVICEFTNVEEEVQAGNIPGPGQPGADDETEEPEVLGRPAEALPLTGSEPGRFIALAALLLLSGAIATRYARKRSH